MNWKMLDNRADGGGNTILVYDEDGTDIAEVYGVAVPDEGAAPPSDPGLANARLVAAAPKLLEVLRVAALYVDPGYEGPVPRPSELIIDIREVIEMAEAETIRMGKVKA